MINTKQQPLKINQNYNTQQILAINIEFSAKIYNIFIFQLFYRILFMYLT